MQAAVPRLVSGKAVAADRGPRFAHRFKRSSADGAVYERDEALLPEGLEHFRDLRHAGGVACLLEQPAVPHEDRVSLEHMVPSAHRKGTEVFRNKRIYGNKKRRKNTQFCVSSTFWCKYTVINNLLFDLRNCDIVTNWFK